MPTASRCHGEGKSKGGLRMDSYDLLMKGGKDGPVIVAGNPEKSVLLSAHHASAGS